MRRSLLIGLLWLGALAGVAAQGGAREQVIQLDKDVVAAYLRGDAAFLERTLAEGYSYTAPDGRVRRRAEAIAAVRSGSLKFDAIEVDDRQAQLYGDAAVVTGRERMKGKSDGKPFEAMIRFTAVYVRQEGRWREAAFQATPVSR